MSTSAITAKPSKRGPEVRSGYKHTKLGWIPEDWQEIALSQLVKRTAVGIVVKPAELYQDDGDVICLRGKNIKPGYVDDTDLVRISEASSMANSKSVLRVGDVVLVRSGEAGTACVVPERYVGANCIDLVIVQPRETVLDAKYLEYYLNSELGIRQIDVGSGGGGLRHFNVGALRQLMIPVPSIREQHRSTAVLCAWDRAIAAVQQLLAAQQLRKQGLMQELLNDVYHRCKKVSIGQVAEEVSERLTDGADHTVLSCTKYKGFVSSLDYFKKQVFSEDRSNYKVIRREQFGFPANHIEEGSIDLLRTHDIGLVSPIYVIFEFDHATVNSEFMYYLFKTERYRHIFLTSTNSSVDRRGSLRWNDFKNLWVPLPEREEQDRLARLFLHLDKQVQLTENYLDHLTSQKRGLMQQLLTGAVRVKATMD